MPVLAVVSDDIVAPLGDRVQTDRFPGRGTAGKAERDARDLAPGGLPALNALAGLADASNQFDHGRGSGPEHETIPGQHEIPARAELAAVFLERRRALQRQ